jgi:hypothetical protein
MAWSPRGVLPYRKRRRKNTMRKVLFEGGFVPRFLPYREMKEHHVKSTLQEIWLLATTQNRR